MPVYLYIIRNNQFHKLFGKITEYYSADSKYLPNHCIFHEISDDGLLRRKPYQVALKEGEIKNSCIWFKEQNDSLAKEKLIEYERIRIEELKRKIKQLELDIVTIESY